MNHEGREGHEGTIEMLGAVPEDVVVRTEVARRSPTAVALRARRQIPGSALQVFAGNDGALLARLLA